MGLLITGMHRSGTSMFAEWVDRLGVPMAKGTEFPVNDANSRGLYESRNFVELNDHWLGVLGGSWWAPPSVREQTWRSIDADALEGSRGTIKSLRTGRKKWFIKDPRISLLLPLWDRFTLARLPVVVGVRSPRDVAMSLHVRNGMTFRRGLAVWCAYNREIVTHLHGRPSLLLDYDAALAEPADAAKSTGLFLFDQGLLAAEPAVDHVVADVEPGLRRQRVTSLQGSADRLADDLTEHYEWLRVAHGQAVPAPMPPMPDWAEEALDELNEFWDLSIRLDIARDLGSAKSLPRRVKGFVFRR